MSRTQQRLAATRFLVAAVLWLACAFGWVAILTFDAADWPSTSSWPIHQPTENWCGPAGAFVAHAAFYYFGAGAYAVAGLVTAAIAAYAHGTRLTDFWLRAVGLALVTTAVGAAGAMYLPASDGWLVTGPGGVLGAVTAHWLYTHLQGGGSLLCLVLGLLVGLVLAADQAMIAFARWLGVVGQKAAPVIVRTGGHALASAGAAMAAGVSSVAGRLAPATAGGTGSVGGAPLVGSGGDDASIAARSAGERDAPGRPAPARSRAAIAAAVEGDGLATDDDRVREIDSTPHGAAWSDRDSAAGGEEIRSNGASDLIDDDTRATAGESGVAADESAVTADDAAPAGPPTVTALGGAKPAARPMALEFPLRVGNYELPPLALLEDPDAINKEAIESLCREKAYVLEQTLNEFRLEVQVVAIETGPVITVFELRLAPGIKVSQIASLTNDMARALKAPAVRVVAPLPGKNTIGIEVPNLDKEKVRLKDLIRCTGTRSDAYAVPLYLGKDASGAPLVTDLTKMPHLLIAGTTGSGKSVCISSIIMSILLTRTPEEVQLIMIDPKVVELAMFKDIPHLMCPIVTEMTKAEALLDWTATKMDERYALLAEAGVKDIRSYNKLGKELLKERMQIDTDEEMAAIPIKLPYLVLIIDELADLMMTSAKEVEFYLCRIAQKSRAVGIHLIVSTQRPQANVVTGLIKSNLPSRIAFRVASRLDSRIVLDQNGGEVLMGQGDMLFLPPGSSKLLRSQGTFISDDELRAVVKHVRGQGQPNYHPELIRMPKAGEELGERDELFDQAVEMILESGRGSVSLLQRKLTIGYSRASRLVEQMYAAGIVGEYKGSQAREVLMSKDEWHALRKQRDAEEAAEQA